MQLSPRHEAAQLLRLALPAMNKHGIAVTPRNYAVWYDYLAGTNAELNTALDGLLAASEPLTDDQIALLYRDYVATFEYRLADQAREVLRRLLVGTSETFSNASDELKHYEGALSSISERLTDESSGDDVRHALHQLVTETQTVQSHSEKLSAGLAEQQREIDALREELAQARKQATTDPLTGLANRGSFDERMLELAAAVRAGEAPFGLIMVDIDRFKQVNDTHGHLVGDKVIRYTAKTLSDSVKGRDLAARYGGEEFAVLLPKTGMDGCHSVAETIRKQMEISRLVKSGTGESLGLITVSCGIAIYRNDDSPESLIARADAALYTSKRNGRNRVTDERAVNLTLADTA